MLGTDEASFANTLSRPHMKFLNITGVKSDPATMSTMRYMKTVAEAADRLCKSPQTVRRWIRSGKLRATRIDGSYAIDDRDLCAIEDDLFPMAELPEDWKLGDDGLPARNWVVALHRSRDRQVETVAAERIRSGATQRTRDGAEVLAELGIHTP